jgi:hypothetical protein
MQNNTLTYQKPLKLLHIIYSSNIIILLIILLSFYLHLSVFIQLADDSPYFFNIQRQTDQDNYISGAEGLLDGTWPADTPFFFSPYYSYYLASTYLIHQDHFAPRLFQIFLGILAITLSYRIGYIVFSRNVGIVSAFTLAIYGPVIFYNLEYNVASHVIVFILGAVNLTLTYRPHKPKRQLFSIGILLGLATISQPQSMILTIPSLLWVIRLHHQSYRLKIITGLTLTAGLAFVLAFPIVHNWTSTGQPMFITSTGARNLYIGNSPEATGTFRGVDPEMLYAVRHGETSYLKEVIRFITEAPDKWLLLMIKKSAFMIIGSDAELGSNFNYHYWGELFSSTLRSLNLRYELIILAVLTTIHLLIRNRKTWILYLYIASYYGATILIFVTARYRVPLTPILIILSIGALFEIIKRLRNKDYKVLILIFAILISYIAVMVRFNLWLETHTFI